MYGLDMSRHLQEPSFLILTALASGPQHGYAVIKDVDAISGGRVAMRVGTLYGALDRLAVAGLVEVDREEVVDSRLRRYYRLTEKGRGVLQVEAERTRDQARAALVRLGVAGALA